MITLLISAIYTYIYSSVSLSLSRPTEGLKSHQQEAWLCKDSARSVLTWTHCWKSHTWSRSTFVHTNTSLNWYHTSEWWTTVQISCIFSTAGISSLLLLPAPPLQRGDSVVPRLHARANRNWLWSRMRDWRRENGCWLFEWQSGDDRTEPDAGFTCSADAFWVGGSTRRLDVCETEVRGHRQGTPHQVINSWISIFFINPHYWAP